MTANGSIVLPTLVWVPVGVLSQAPVRVAPRGRSLERSLAITRHGAATERASSG